MTSEDDSESAAGILPAPRICGLFGLLVSAVWLPTDARAVEGLLATQPDKFKPVTLDAGRSVFQIPPDSRLACNEHPRLLLAKEDLETLLKRLADSRLVVEFQAVKRHAESARDTDTVGLKRALLWRLTGDRKYLDTLSTALPIKGSVLLTIYKVSLLQIRLSCVLTKPRRKVARLPYPNRKSPP